MGDIVAPQDRGPDPDLATIQRQILLAASSGIDLAINAEIRRQLDRLALEMIERGYSRDVRAASRYYVKTRQLDIAAARAATETMRAERASSDGSSATMHIDLSVLRTIVTQAQQGVADGTGPV